MRAKTPSRSAIVVALLAAMLPLFAPPARADDFAPEITSFTRTSDGLLGGHQVVTIDFTARDDGPAGLSYAMFTFQTPLEGFVRVDSPFMQRAAAGSFTATKLLSPWAASGRYTLEKVEVSDREGNTTTYERSGTHGLDLRDADFSVENHNEDVTVPTMSSAELFQTEVLQGTPVVALYSVQDDVSGVEEVNVIGWSPSGGQYTLRSLPQLGAAGPATWLVPLSSPSGRYEPHAIHVTDRAGNSVRYDVEGRVDPYPFGATVPPHDHPDPATLSFDVRGTTGDRVAPQMTQFSAITPTRRRPGELVAIDYRTVDAGTGVAWVLAEWVDGRGHSLIATKSCGDLGRGPLSTTVEDYRTTGTDWQLRYVAFSDYLGNHAGYLRDGTVQYQNTDPGPPVHPFDFSQADFHLEEGPPSRDDLLDTTSLYCPRVADVSLDLDYDDVTFGDAVSITGVVEGPSSPVSEPLVAVHQYLRRGPRLVGVVEGDSAGSYTRSFTAAENTTFSASFLGLDGPGGAEPATSRRTSLTVRARVTASLSHDTIPRGGSARVGGAVDPAHAADTVLLQRKVGRRWRTVQETPAAGGDFSFVVRPPRAGTFRYRAVVPEGPRLARGRSAVEVLTVTR